MVGELVSRPRGAGFYDAPGTLCSVSGCARPKRANGMCKMHYARTWRRKHSIRAVYFRPIPIPPHLNPLITRLFEIMNEQQVTIAHLQEMVGLSVTTIGQWKSLKRGNGATVTNLEACFNAIGYELTVQERKE